MNEAKSTSDTSPADNRGAPLLTPPPAAPEPTLYCPTCRYNLTGLTEDRCPECGFRFSWTQLRETTRFAMPWEVETSIKNFFVSCHRAMFSPHWLVSSLDREFDATAAWRFSLVCILLATVPSELVMLAPALISGQHETLKATSAVNFGFLIAFFVCNPLTAAGLSCLPDPRRRGFRFWHGVMHYLSCFSVVTGILILAGAVLLGSGSIFAPAALALPIVLIIWIACYVMCVGSVVAAVCEFGDRSLWGAFIAAATGGFCVALAAGAVFLTTGL